MACSTAARLAVFSFLAATMAVAQRTDIPVTDSPFNGQPIVVSVVEPEIGKSQQGDDPTVSKPDQVFSGNSKAISGSLGVEDGEPVVDVQPGQPGRKMLAKSVRKLQQTDPATNAAGLTPYNLKLTGDGESVGSSTAGVQGKAYGNGDGSSANPANGGVHIQPHGGTVDASALGNGLNGVQAGVNPNGVAGEGSVAYVGK